MHNISPSLPSGTSLAESRSLSPRSRRATGLTWLFLAAALLTGVSLAGCSLTGNEDPPPRFEVTVSGALTDAFSGDATFDSLKSTAILFPPFAAPPTFRVSLDDERRVNDRYVFLTKQGRFRPDIGTYAVDRFEKLFIDGDVFVGQLQVDTTVYRSVSGRVEVTESSDDLFAGTFSFAAEAESDNGPAKTVQVDGSFRARPQSYRDVFPQDE